MRQLFVAGPQRSGTTALVHYLNQLPEVLMCMERYKWVHPSNIRPEYFTFERILDYRERPGRRKEETDTPRKFHAELVASKKLAQLEWIGDKNPGYVRNLKWLFQNNPEASLILTYRPLEEVAESWEAIHRSSEDALSPGRWALGGFETGVEYWNDAMRATRDFIESAINLNVLVLDYHDFFRTQKAVPLLARFLDLEIDRDVLDAWDKSSRSFESDRRSKEPLSEKQRSYIEANKDYEAEQWVLDRIERQQRELDLCPPEFSRLLARERRLSATRISKERGRHRHLRKQDKELREQNRELKRQNLALERQLEAVHSSRTWRLLDGANRLKKRALRLFSG